MKSFIDNDNEIILNTYRGDSKAKAIKSSELIEIIEARIEEMKEGNFTQDDLEFLNDTIDSLMDMLMAAKSEIKLYMEVK